MAGQLCILCCSNFVGEVSAVIRAEAWQDVSVSAFESRCGRPPMSWEALQTRLPESTTHVVILGRACLKDLAQPPANFPEVKLAKFGECFDLVASQSLVRDAIAGGAYLMSPGWLLEWRSKIEQLGFTADRANAFFKDFAKELLLFDTGVSPDAERLLAEMSQVVGLPARLMPVGLDYTRLFLVRLVLEWRYEQARQRELRCAGDLADSFAAMDFLARLARSQHEQDAITDIKALFEMLFAPQELHYLQVDGDVSVPTGAIPAKVIEQLNGMRDAYCRTDDGLGFMLAITSGSATVARIAILKVAFPEKIDRYINFALKVTGVCALAIESARFRKKLLEAEKMASLAILVAGVAHEINTPLGVGLAAASLLQNQSGELEKQFAARTMTQSALSGFLANTKTESGLIRSNLERIGDLVGTFRQVAVLSNPAERRVFNLRSCIEQVIQSFGDRLPVDRVRLSVECPADLVINSFSGDWTSIFDNLIGNSLKHGIGENGRGCIGISVATDGAALKVDYRDDGAGMAPETLACVFDPFFTTNHQLGLGLGMHLVYNLVTHRMGGSIRCASAPGRGVHFHIEVPI